LIDGNFFAISFVMRILLLILLICPMLFADEEIVVHLTSHENLVPLYLAPFQDKECEFDKNYLSSLEKVLRFDLEHNGKTELSISSKTLYKIETVLDKKTAHIKVNTGDSIKGIEGISLTGDIAKDRQTIHRIHDAIFETLFHSPGIAETHILYTIRSRKNDNPAEWASDVWEADYDGANAKQITHDGCLCVTPTFIPSKRTGPCRNFLYVSYKIGQPKIYAGTLEESTGKRLTYLRGNQLMPAVSPKLDKIAFVSDITGNPDLFVQDYSPEKGLEGKPRQVFCAPGATQGTPTFSPDGKKLAFVSNKDGTPRIYILDIPAPGESVTHLKPKMITKKTKENTCPAWSPDGKKIAYSAMTSGTRQIWVYDLTTGEEMQLTDGLGHKENPAWAPNSLHLMFNSSTITSSDLFMINLNQKQAVRITSGQGEKRFPAWEPIRKG
jgi:TolB protein